MLKIKVRVLLTLIFIANNLFWAVQVRSDDGGGAAGKSSSKEVNSTVEVDFESIIGVTGGKFNFYGFKSGMSKSQLKVAAKLNGLLSYAEYKAKERRKWTAHYRAEYEKSKRKNPSTTGPWETSFEKSMVQTYLNNPSPEESLYLYTQRAYKVGSRFAKLGDIGFSFRPYFTSQNRLWRLDVKFYKRGDDLLEEIAQRTAIQEKFNTDFPGIEMKKDGERTTADSPYREFYLFQFIDYKVANASIAFHKSRFGSKLNH